MCDFDRRGKKNPPPAGADRGAKVHVFEIHEIPLVEQPDGFGIRALHEKAGAAHPVGRLFLPRHEADALQDATAAALESLDQLLLTPLGERRDHFPERQFGMSFAVHDARTDHSDIGVTPELTHEAVDSATRFLLDRALGPEGYYGLFGILVHTDIADAPADVPAINVPC